MDLSKTNIELVERVYKTLESNIALFKARKGNSLTLAEKILYDMLGMSLRHPWLEEKILEISYQTE